MSYHIKDIEKGVNGSLSKIREELDECFDAEEQGNKIMVLVELSDIIGAVELYLENNFSEMTIQDLIIMKDATKRAFNSGARK